MVSASSLYCFASPVLESGLSPSVELHMWFYKKFIGFLDSCRAFTLVKHCHHTEWVELIVVVPSLTCTEIETDNDDVKLSFYGLMTL